jgi:predicted Zn finger-like uncharacterized protein
MSTSDPVRVRCPECGAGVRVEATALGQWVKCPECADRFRARADAAKSKPPAARDERDDDDDRDRGRSRRREREYDEDEDDDYPAPRDGEPEPGTCPECGCRRSVKVSYTWWGGLVGPAVFSMVRCTDCDQRYNRKTGRPVGAPQIIGYTVVCLVIAAVVLGALFLAGG